MTHIHRVLMTSLLVVLVSLQTLAQSVQWLPGLDIIVPLYASRTIPDGFLGYDRDTGTASRLNALGVCHEQWTWTPSEDKGAITQILQIADYDFALYHESGFIRVERQPASLHCNPLPPQKP